MSRRVTYVYEGKRISWEELVARKGLIIPSTKKPIENSANMGKKKSACDTKVILSLQGVNNPERDSELFSIPMDIIDVIVNMLIDGKTYKSMLFVCKYLYDTHKHKKLKYCNQLWTLILKYPNKSWYWYKVCKNKNTSINLFEKYNSYYDKCDWRGLTANPNTTIDVFRKYMDKPWKMSALHKNPNITEQYIEELMDFPRFIHKFNWGKFSKHPNLSLTFVEKHMNTQGIEWNFAQLSKNPNITLDFMLKYHDRNWDWGNVYRNKAISCNDKGIQLTGNTVRHMCSNPGMTIEFIDEHIDNYGEFFDWIALSAHSNIKMEDIFKTMEIDNRYRWTREISLNKNLTGDFIKEHGAFYFDMTYLSLNKGMSAIDFLREIRGEQYTPNIEAGETDTEYWKHWWDPSFASRNPNITIDLIEKHIDYCWSWSSISENEFIPPQDLNAYTKQLQNYLSEK